MSKQRDRISKRLRKAGMAWATSATKHVHPDDPLEDQSAGRKTWHVHPDASYPHTRNVHRFDTLDALEAWLDERGA
jgi:hypothetical protein